MRESTLITDAIHDRAVGALLGLATGDAVGTTLEYKSRDSYEHLTGMVGGGPFSLPAGMWTDDTSMALALGESLEGRIDLDPEDLMSRFVRWWRSGEYSPTGECFGIGLTTRAALAHFETTGEPIAGSRDEMTAGNGSLMRVAPIAIWGVQAGADAMRDVARTQSATTHAARACLDACEAYSVMMRSAILGADFSECLARAQEMSFIEPIAGIIAGGWRSKTRAQIATSGYVAHSLEAALWCNDPQAGGGGTYRDIVLRAANLGDDANTTAAIAGQLAGALHGKSGIPPEWLEKLVWADRISALAGRLLSEPARP
ncbi:hypothetical protein A9995_15350 [Erythrobacter sp. QSSC1-22B]|nr:hypothetical protein A9995_15350 [Erythrobacter sp. QSSC1-22B]